MFKSARPDVGRSGFVLLLTLVLMITLSAIVGALIVSLTTDFRNTSFQSYDAKALWLAEAGLQKAIWNLETPVSSGGQGQSWTTTGTTENLGDGSYTMVVAAWSFALDTNGATASASSSTPGNTAAKAIDGKDATRWHSKKVPSVSNPEHITVTFPYAIKISKARFFVASGAPSHRPEDYSWKVSTDGVSFTTVLTVTGNLSGDRTDTFTEVSNVNHLRLEVTATGGANSVVQIGTLEAAPGTMKITSTGTVNSLSRKVERTVLADEASQTATVQDDWDEITS